MDIMYSTVLAFGIIALATFVSGRMTAGKKVRSSDPVIISSPRLGFLNLMDEEGAGLMEADKEAFEARFSGIQVSTTAPPPCDVLFIYANISAAGRILGSESGLKEIVRNSGACVAIMAADSSSDNYGEALKSKEPSYANLVLILDRKGPLFHLFFNRLFDQMFKGVTMPMAWVKLAPQDPSAVHSEGPGAIMVLNGGQVSFASMQRAAWRPSPTRPKSPA